MAETKQLVIPVITEVHQTTRVRAGSVTVACCAKLVEEYGKDFVLCADGGLAPASLRIERNKMGKIVMDKPKTGWQQCPMCGTPWIMDTQTVVKKIGDTYAL
jgi:hypothetical protein